MPDLLSGVALETRVIMLFGLIGFIILVAGTVLLVGLRRQSAVDAGRFDIPARDRKPKKEKPAKVKKEKPAKAPKPEKVKQEKPEPAPKPEKAKKEKGGLFKKKQKPTGVKLLAAPVGSAPAPQAPKPAVQQPAPVAPKTNDDFDIPAAAPAMPKQDDDFDIPDFTQPPAPRPATSPGTPGGPFGKPATAGEDEW